MKPFLLLDKETNKQVAVYFSCYKYVKSLGWGELGWSLHWLPPPPLSCLFKNRYYKTVAYLTKYKISREMHLKVFT